MRVLVMYGSGSSFDPVYIGFYGGSMGLYRGYIGHRGISTPFPLP